MNLKQIHIQKTTRIKGSQLNILVNSGKIQLWYFLNNKNSLILCATFISQSFVLNIKEFY